MTRTETTLALPAIATARAASHAAPVPLKFPVGSTSAILNPKYATVLAQNPKNRNAAKNV
jgi:hypothetical protein